jgi:hypothetical protein
MILLNISAEKNGEKLAVLTQNTAFHDKKAYNIGFQEKRNFFRRKLATFAKKIVIITLTPEVGRPHQQQRSLRARRDDRDVCAVRLRQPRQHRRHAGVTRHHLSAEKKRFF